VDGNEGKDGLAGDIINVEIEENECPGAAFIAAYCMLRLCKY
jgi:hypothetical protein